MTIKDLAAKKRLEDMLHEAEDAPSLPAVALEVLRISQDEEASLDDLAAVIALDPALSARLMRYANSALYNPGSEVSTLQRAAMLLGLKTVQLMALSFSLTEGIPKAGTGSFDYTLFWRRSSVRAVAARAIAQSSGSLMPDEAFLCGLICEFGQIVLAQCVREEFNQVLAGSPTRLPQRKLESAILGFDHVDTLGALLLEWGFPQSIRDTLEDSLEDRDIDPEKAPVQHSNAKVLNLARLATDILTLEAPGSTLEELEHEAMQHLGLQQTTVQEILDSLEKGVLELDQLLGLDLPEGKSISEVLEHARSQQRNLAANKGCKHSIGMQIHEDLNGGTEEEDEVHGEDAFEYYLERSIEARLEGSTPFPIGLLYLDVNNVEDLPSDAPMGALGVALSEVVRKSDLWARISEGQYAVVMNESSPIGLRRLAERVRSVLREVETRDPDVHLQRTQVTIGGACLGPVRLTEDVETLKGMARQLAFKALSRAGGACYVHPQQLRSAG